MVENQIVIYDEPKWTVYVHENKINGKKYVGITSQIPQKRWGKNGNGYKNGYFKNAITHYGWNEFYHIVLNSNYTSIEAKQIERMLIKELHTNDQRFGYNLTTGGDGTCGMIPYNNWKYIWTFNCFIQRPIFDQ